MRNHRFAEERKDWTSYDADGDFDAMTELFELPPSPWRSLGRHLDYGSWPDRDRFVILDREIKVTSTRNP